MRKLGVLLGFFVVGALAWRLSYLGYNLPVCANVDERTALGVLLHLSTQDPNPHFFNYPTLYFYSTWLLTRPFWTLADPLLLGRIVNLVIGLALGPAAYFLAWKLFRSHLAGAIAAAATLASSTLTRNAGYLATDPLLALLLLLGVGLLTGTATPARPARWLGAMICFGLALGTKYTAFLMLAAYWFWELSMPEPAAGTGKLDRPLPGWLLPSIALLAGAGCAGMALAWPETRLLAGLGTATKVDAAMDSADLAWLSSLRLRVGLLGILLLVGGLAAATRQRLALPLARLRPHLGLLIAGAVFLVTTPFALLSWHEALYDVGSELKANALRGDHGQWLAVLDWYRTRESLALLLAAIAGGVALRRSRPVRLLLLYLLLSYLAIGAARRGYPRYLTPVLPFLFVLAGGGCAWVREQFGRGRPRLTALLLASLLTIAGIESAVKLGTAHEELKQPNEMWQTYQWVTARPPGRLIQAGYAPGVELAAAGWAITAIPRQQLADSTGLDHGWVGGGDLLLMDSLARAALHPALAARLQPLLSLEQGYGQHLFMLLPPPAAGAQAISSP